MSSFVELKNVYKRYKMGEVTITASNGVSFTIEKGEFAVIVGSSGAGKTTILNILGGMDRATSGTYIVEGKDITQLNNHELTKFRREKIGFVFQFYNLMNNLTAYENVSLATKKIKDHLDPKLILEKVGLGKRLNNFPSNLSGGEQQRVSIARALVKKPQILLCDEPTGALDSKTGQTIIALLKDLSKSEDSAVVVVTHNANIALVADRVIKLSDGKIVSDEYNESPKDVKDIVW